jgi:hypothetical protein
MSAIPEDLLMAPQGDVRLLQTDVAQRLLTSTELARVAYVATDGTPRVFPMLFHWTGDDRFLFGDHDGPLQGFRVRGKETEHLFFRVLGIGIPTGLTCFTLTHQDRHVLIEQARDPAKNPDGDPAGSWRETEFTGTGFPKVFYLRYHMYRLYFPIMAIGRYLTAHGVNAESSRTREPERRPEMASA